MTMLLKPLACDVTVVDITNITHQILPNIGVGDALDIVEPHVRLDVLSASRRSVSIRSPGFRGINDGATTRTFVPGRDKL